MIQIAMFLLQLLRKPIEWMGADYYQLRLILKTKLTLDFRRGPSSFNTSGRKKQTFKTQLIIFAMIGLFISFGFFNIHDVLLNYTIAYSVIMVMLATTLIGEFTSVLFDHRDNQIILVRPVNNRTLLLSRLLHVQFYMMYIAVALSLVSTIVTIFKYSLITAVFYFTGVMLCAWIAVLITTLFYFIISKFVSGERFKDIITYVQIFLVIIVMGGYQLLPRMMDVKGIADYSMSIHGYTYFVPPAWLAAFVHLSMPLSVTREILLLAIPGIVFAIAGGIFLIRFLSGGFTGILALNAEGSAENEKTVTKEKTKPVSGLYRFLCISEIEKTGWKMAMQVTRRDRKFKQAVYPSYGLLIVMLIVMLKPDLNNLAAWYQNLGESSRYLFIIFFGFFATSCIEQIKYTDNPEAGWIYRVLPLQFPGHLLTGAVKAMIIKFFLPVYMFLTVATTFVWGIHILPLMFLGAIFVITSSLITLLFQNRALPFTQPREMQQKSNNFLKIILGTLIMGAIVGIVYLASMLPLWAVLFIGIIALFGNSQLYNIIRKTKFVMED